MQDSDAKHFERAMTRLCAGFNVPTTEPRKEAYWRSFRKLSLLEFTGLIDLALVESSYTEMPTVGALWELHRKNSAPAPEPISAPSGPTLQEQLCAYASLKLHARLTPLEFSMPWTYVHREWREGDKRCAECTGIMVDLADGSKLGFSVDAMRADVEGHAKALRSFRPGPQPTDAQMAAYHSKLPGLRAP